MSRKLGILGGTGPEGSGLAYRWARAGVPLRPHGARADDDDVGECTQRVEDQFVARPPEPAARCARGGAAVHAGDEVRPHPTAVQLLGIAVQLG